MSIPVCAGRNLPVVQLTTVLQTFEIDLDLPPAARYAALIAHFKHTAGVARLRDLAADFDTWAIRWLLYRPMLQMLPRALRLEAVAMAAGLDIPLHSFLVLQ